MNYLFNELDRYDEDDWSLWSVLQEAVDHWHEVFEEYWGLRKDQDETSVDADTRANWQKLDEMAPRLLRGALALQLSALKPNPASSVELTPDMVELARRILQVYGKSLIVRDRWSFAVAHDAMERLEGSSTRVAELLNVILLHQFDDRTAAYLARVARLYVYGFEIEALVMCRSALEAALQDVLPDEVMSEQGFVKAGPEYTLASRIAAAERMGYFDGEKKRAAHVLRKASNEAVHTAPGFLQDGVGSGVEAIQMLADLLDALSTK